MMPTSVRSSWKGAISFGLVTVPVRLFPATQEHSIPLHQVHESDGSRVKMRRFCEAEDREIPYEEIAKGYESPTGRTVVLTGDDLADLPLPSKKIIDVLAFVDADTIDPLMFSRAYYVGTETSGAKAYALLRETLAETGQVAVTKVTLSTRESLAVLRVHQDVIVLQLMLWPDELRSAGDVAPDTPVTIRPQEKAMAKSLMDTLSEGFDLADLHDEYQAALQDVVDARLAGTDTPHEGPPRVVGESNVIDLMAALKRSVKAAEATRASTPAPAPAPARKTTKATSAKRASPPATKKSTAAKKTTAEKKTAAKTAPTPRRRAS